MFHKKRQIRVFGGTLFIVVGIFVLSLSWQSYALSHDSQREIGIQKEKSTVLHFDHPTMMTTTESHVTIRGTIKPVLPDIHLVIQDVELKPDDNGRFSYDMPLQMGTNFIRVALYRTGIQYDEQHLIIFKKEMQMASKDVMLWIEQGPNANRFQSTEHIEKLVLQAKDAGITALVVDVKGVAGYALYRRAVRTQRPYVDTMRRYKSVFEHAQHEKLEPIDALEELIRYAHDVGIHVYASSNVFAEGSIANNEYAVLEEHPEWETVVYHPRDGGSLLPLRLSQYGRHEANVAFINPLHEEARLYQLQTIAEVIEEYDIDGIIIDRGRYDNMFSDFSDETREQFTAYLATRNKRLIHWPTDVFTYIGMQRVAGPLFFEWLTFRSHTVKQFIRDVRTIVDFYNMMEQRNIRLGVYTGSWYDAMYAHGVNYASPHFVYDKRLRFPLAELYGAQYARTTYLPYLDFLIIGAYQSSPTGIERYITLANIVTNGEIPLYTGVQLANIPLPDTLRVVLQSGLTATDGIMLFDLSQVNFPVVEAALGDEPFTSTYQLGISVPGDSGEFIEADFLNENRHVRNTNVYTSDYGFFTHTDKWGVEVVVGADGYVERVINKHQAASWQWQQVEENNAPIPPKGFVISANDASGERTNRQLIAKTYDVGDAVRAALLSGWHTYEGAEVHHPYVVMSGRVHVLGTGDATVFVSARPVSSTDEQQRVSVWKQTVPMENGHFRVVLELGEGEYIVHWEVFVDGMKTNEIQFLFVRGPDDTDRGETCTDCLDLL